jgi:2-polyprenyl-3-methyl-5-hydroxy-6-metoxy-1,4-benzoquinol methylase
MVFMIKKKIDNLSISEILQLFKSDEFDSDADIELSLSCDNFQTISIKGFVELAQIFLYKVTDIRHHKNRYFVHLQKLDTKKSFHNKEDSVDKYGTKSEFFTIDKIKEFSFLHYYQEALKFVDIYTKNSVLNIGVNKGDEFSAIKEILPKEMYLSKHFVGIDYSSSAIEYAKQHIRDENVDFLCRDINKLQEINLGRFDLLISIGTLQSSNISFNAKFMELFQNHLQKGGAVVLGFPNCRWVDDEMIYGAKAPNYSFNEMSLVLKDIHFCKKYLQQKGYRVVITGKDYLFLSARVIKVDSF